MGVPSYGHEALRVSGILDLPDPGFEPGGTGATASAALARVGSSEVAGFPTLVDADVLDPLVMPAVGSPEPGGPGIDELAAFLAPLVSHPKALGMALTLYDPSLDPWTDVRSTARATCSKILVERQGATGSPNHAST